VHAPVRALSSIADRDPQPTTLHEWFARSAAAHPDEPALEVGSVVLSYRELEAAAASVAARLTADLPARPRRAALLASRSVAAYAGYLALQRLGTTVVPLNPAYPQVRNAKVCELAEADVILVEEEAGARLRETAEAPLPPIVRLTDSELVAAARSAAPADLPPSPADPDSVAYILFTSGSTGVPKGVPITHRNISAYLAHNIRRFDIGPGCRLSHTFDLTFDPSMFDLFGAWGGGATLVVPQRAELLTPVDYLVRRRITHWASVPSVISVSEALGSLPPGQVTELRHSLFIGEQLTAEQAARWRATAPGTAIDNVYGPTELTVACTEYRLSGDPSEWPRTSNDTVPIGPVYSFLEHVILDEDGKPAAEGELCVRGPQRFGGYLDPRDDVGRFVRAGAQPDEAAVVYDGGGVTAELHYRTGDRVRWESGLLVHLGRLDNQVKVHGYRVELGEIEVALNRHPAVRRAVVLAARRGSETELVAWYTGQATPAAALADWLRQRLPAHMVPRRCTHLDTLPLTANGKTDRLALAESLSAGAGAAAE
jgi:amino acid adenylation domain-containing protein